MTNQLLFLLSAIGGLNGILLSTYFAFFIKNRNRSTYFLSALILTLSIRITKSAFLFINRNIFEFFIEFGLIACALIGPFLYLYIKETKKTIVAKKSYTWLWHVIPAVVIMVVWFYFYPYKKNKGKLWGLGFMSFGYLLYTQWFIYILISGYLIKDSLKKLFSKNEKLTDKEFWLVNLVIGIGIVWLAYKTVNYTSYIVGALSFSFIFYLSLVIWFMRRKKATIFFEEEEKYRFSLISDEEAILIKTKLFEIFKEKSLFKDHTIKLKNLAKEINVTPHQLSQFLNNNLQKSFNQYINEFRVEEAKKILKTNDSFTLEAIGYEVGFSSNTTFYAAFKKVTGSTPAKYRKQFKG
ncbi:AraC family transcriptional regulator [Tenacibaculum aiptasiae]|uniref:AraC family transcriptional regulator n=1 Tax=Tenacibaculum aiptasiae TaxID=426481 RepID=UPI00232FCD2A|nr:helix-turn-helix domain-containing protein [Tenacibaculum aiptasiae]